MTMQKKLSPIILVFISFASLAQDGALQAESAVTSTSTVTIKGKVVPYKATAGTQPSMG